MIKNRITALLAALAVGLCLSAIFAPAASAGNVPSQVKNRAGSPVRVDYNLGHGPYATLYEQIGPKDPWKSKITDDVDAFKSYGDKRCVRVANPVTAKQRGVWYVLPDKWYPISSLSIVDVYAYGSSSSPNDCTANHELPPKA